MFADNDSDGVQDAGEPTDSVQQVVVQGPLSISVTPANETNDVNTDHTVTATVTDGNGDPVEGMGVFFETYGTVYCAYQYGCGDGQYKLTNASGEATYTYSSSSAGNDTIYAYADGDGIGIPVLQLRPMAATLRRPGELRTPATEIVLSADSLLKITTGTQRCVSSTATTASGGAYGNRPVGLTVSGANSASSNGNTDSNGQTTLCYTPTNAGTDTLTVFADNDGNGTHERPVEPTDNVQQVVVQGPVAIIALARERDQQVGTNHTVTATVTDGNGDPVEGMGVFFEAFGTVYCWYYYGCGDGQYKLTNASGEATFTYSSSTAGTDAIYAYADDDGSASPTTATRTARLQRPGIPHHRPHLRR